MSSTCYEEIAGCYEETADVEVIGYNTANSINSSGPLISSPAIFNGVASPQGAMARRVEDGRELDHCTADFAPGGVRSPIKYRYFLFHLHER